MRLALLLCLLGATVPGQWIKYPTSGTPRGPDGKPNLLAPAPRTPDGKPDLSGMWIIGEALPCPKLITDDQGECLEKMPISQFAADLNKVVPAACLFSPGLWKRAGSGNNPGWIHTSDACPPISRVCSPCPTSPSSCRLQACWRC